jgi:hypothetical protein
LEQERSSYCRHSFTSFKFSKVKNSVDAVESEPVETSN